MYQACVHGCALWVPRSSATTLFLLYLPTIFYVIHTCGFPMFSLSPFLSLMLLTPSLLLSTSTFRSLLTPPPPLFPHPLLLPPCGLHGAPEPLHMRYSPVQLSNGSSHHDCEWVARGEGSSCKHSGV